jgi:hypothetical protein
VQGIALRPRPALITGYDFCFLSIISHSKAELEICSSSPNPHLKWKQDFGRKFLAKYFDPNNFFKKLDFSTPMKKPLSREKDGKKILSCPAGAR